MKPVSPVSQLAAWRALEDHAREIGPVHMREFFANDPDRFEAFSLEAEGILLDYSRNRLNQETLALLIRLAEERDLRGWIDRMFAGQAVNNTENRAALHVALRNRSARPMAADGEDVMPAVRSELDKMRGLVESLTHREFLGSTGQPITDVVNIGIGGSDLGAVMAVEALRRYRSSDLRVHFVSNVDGAQLRDVLDEVHPETTLFIVCSKTFTTQETLTLAHLAKDWLFRHTTNTAMGSHFVAVSGNQAAMEEFGITPDNRFDLWDWVGGRYSLWSPIGLAIAVAVGMDNFETLLEGGHAMDEHFRAAPLGANLPVLLALTEVWNRNFLGTTSHAVLPYDQRLSRFPAYLQQLEMESLGKSVTRDGEPVGVDTCPVIWGEPGSNAQHSFMQLLHQGSGKVSVDFLLPVNDSSSYPEQHKLAIANCLAQAQALMEGQGAEQLRKQMLAEDLGTDDVERLLPHKLQAGNKPSNLIVFPRLDPGTLGKLIALYEHKVFVEGVIWGLNPFDQWGVELGKRLAKDLVPAIRRGEADGLDPSVQALMSYLAKWHN